MITALSMIIDVLLILMSYFIAVFLRFDVLRGRRSVTYSSAPFVLGALLCAAGIVIVLYALRMYRPKRLDNHRGEALTVMSVVGVFALLFVSVLYVRRVNDFSRMALGFFWLIASVLIIAEHRCFAWLLAALRRMGFNQKHVLIVGSGRLARQYAEDVHRNPHLGYSVDGYVSDAAQEMPGCRLGGYDDLDAVLDSRTFDEMIVALEPQEIGHMHSVMASAGRAGIRLSLIPFFNDYIPSQPAIEVIEHTHLIDMRATPLDHLGWAMIKRAMDIAGSLVLIILTSPLMLAVAVGVKLSSPGPVIFGQERVGLNKKLFRMYKFRSMRLNDAQDTGWSTKKDPRKTRVGSVIRKYSLDELPQFFNVLKGDMSLIGPRPEVPFHVNRFKEEIPLYLLRQQVRPGMTGWAQVHGLRGDTSICDRVEYDLWYIQNWSLTLDIRILLMTAFGGLASGE